MTELPVSHLTELPVSHLSVFKLGERLCKRLREAKEHNGEDVSILSGGFSSSGDDLKRCCTVEVGDIAVYIPSIHVHGDFSHLTYGTITEVTDGTIALDNLHVLDPHNQWALVYRYDSKCHVLKDVSEKFVKTSHISWLPGRLELDSYTTISDRMTDTLARRSEQLQRSLEEKGLPSISTHWKRPAMRDNQSLNDAMAKIICQLRENQNLQREIHLLETRSELDETSCVPLDPTFDGNASASEGDDISDRVHVEKDEKEVERSDAVLRDNIRGEQQPSGDYRSRGVLEKNLANTLAKMEVPWHGSIEFEVIEVTNKEPVDAPDQTAAKLVDICTYLNKSKSLIRRLYFPIEKYVPPEEGCRPRGSAGWECLKADIERAAWDGKCPVICNGQPGENHSSRAFICGVAGKIQKSKATQGHTLSDFRSSSLINDKKNQRKDGKKRPRRCKLASYSKRCPFLFVVKWDAAGFFIDLTRKQGNPVHVGHPNLMNVEAAPFPTRLLTEDERESIRQVKQSTSNKGSARNFALQTFGRFVNNVSIGNLFRDKSRQGEDAIGGDVSKMLSNFDANPNVHYMTLSNVPVDLIKSLDGLKDCPVGDNEGTLTISRGKCHDDSNVVMASDSSPELTEIDKVVMQERMERRLKPTDTLFIAVAWMVVPLFRYFCLCPEVIWVDVTSHSNNKGFHLFTVSCRATSLNKQVVVMWIWIPNQRRFSFRWVFQHVFPKLVPKKFRDRVRLIMADGDFQQRNEILKSTEGVFRNAVFGTCGFHIVTLGFKKHGPSANSVSSHLQERWKSVCDRVKEWCYSWMKPGYCEDNDEFQLSKHLLIAFVQSKSVLEAAGGDKRVPSNMLEWLRGHVFTHLNDLLWHLRKKRRCYNTHHSSPHEGTNHGMKAHSAGVKGTMGVYEASLTILTQAEVKMAELNELCWQEYQKPKKDLWSNYAHSNCTTVASEGTIREENMHAKQYEPMRVGTNEFETHYVGGDTGDGGVDRACMDVYESSVRHNAIPLFRRVRRVTIVEGRMYCSCSKFECVGHHCRHMFSVAAYVHQSMGSTFRGFPGEQLAMRHRSVYMQFAYREDTPRELWENLDSLASNEIDGPELGVELPSVATMPIQRRSVDQPAVDRLKNYNVKDVKEYLKEVEETSFDGMISNVGVRRGEVGGGTTDLGSETEMMFSESVKDSDLPRASGDGARTRDIMKQSWEELCVMADQLGEEARGVLGDGLNELRVRMMNLRETDPCATPENRTELMTTSTHQGKGRVFTTNKMLGGMGKRKRGGGSR